MLSQQRSWLNSIGAGDGRSIARVVDLLPRGRTLSEASWRLRHRAILILLWLHVGGVPVFALAAGNTVAHTLLEVLPVAVTATVASYGRLGRPVRTSAATLGLLTASAVLVHASGGVIEMHFHFFVMVPVIALYQNWFPFLLAIGYVLFQHGVAGALSPANVYNHPAAIAAPWRWAAIHALFIAGISVVCVINWRLNEVALDHRRRAEAELGDALSVLTATLEATADGILVVARDGSIMELNQRFIDMWRIPDDIVRSRDDARALGFVLDQLIDPDAFISKVRALYDSAEESLDDLDFKDGRVVERYSQPLWVDGARAGRVWSFRDVTERRRAEDALREAQARDRETVTRLRALDETKDLFLTAVSHEIRTPLAAVTGFAHTLREKGEQLDPQRRQEIYGRLGSSAERLRRLLMDVFDLDRLRRGVLEPRRRPVELSELVGRVVSDLDVSGRVVLRCQPVTVALDVGMIERVVENLVANALKHTPRDTQIRVSVTNSAGGALLSVDDEGAGVPDEMKQAIFEPLQQAMTPSHSPGTGIGLALVSRFVALHGGRAWVEDLAAGGSSFRVTLPDAAALEVLSTPGREAPPDAAPAASDHLPAEVPER